MNHDRLKHFEIKSSTGMNMFVCLGGFHQSMSFPGSTGCRMEGNDERSTIESVYVPLAAGHLFSGKASYCLTTYATSLVKIFATN